MYTFKLYIVNKFMIKDYKFIIYKLIYLIFKNYKS